MKTIAFILDSHTYMRHYSIFLRLLKKDYNFVFIHSYQKKYDQSLKFKNFPLLFATDYIQNSKNYMFENRNDFINLLKCLDIDLIFSLNFFSFYKISKSNLNKIKWITLQSWGDTFFSIEKNKNLKCDFFFIYSNLWLENYSKNVLNLKKNYDIQNKSKEIGNPNFLYKYIKFDKRYIHHKYSLNNKKKSLIYFPIGTPTLYGFNNIWQKIWLSEIYSINPKYKFFSILLKKLFFFLPFPKKFKIDEEKILKQIKNFCIKNNYQLILKSRYKQTYPIRVEQYVDKVIYDESYSDPTIYEIFSISNITIGHYSMANIESLYFNCFTINLKLPIKQKIFTNHLDIFFDNWKNLLNFNNSSQEIEIEDFIKNFQFKKSSSMENFNKNINLSLNKFFIKFSKSSFKKVLDLLSL